MNEPGDNMNPSAIGADSAAALDFLRDIRPTGPWCITAIWPERADKRPTPTKTYGPESADACAAAIIKASSEGWNTYYTLNTTRGPVTKKPTKADIKQVDFLHVDIDIPAAPADASEEQRAEFIAREKAVILNRLIANRPNDVPVPTYIIDSGGGAQALWRLREPIILTDIASCEEAERFNRWLEAQFNADHCHNIDRVLRLPGSVNHPDAKKRAKGRRPALAKLVHHEKGGSL